MKLYAIIVLNAILFAKFRAFAMHFLQIYIFYYVVFMQFAIK